MLGRQEFRFVLVGILNTAIDFTILNILVTALDWHRIAANIVAISVAVMFSFWANRTFVFRHRQGSRRQQAIKFIGGTLFGLYVIQTLVIYFTTEVWTGPIDLGQNILEAIGLGETFSYEFLLTNGSKVLATVFTLFWNYWFYKHHVFVGKQADSDEKS